MKTKQLIALAGIGVITGSFLFLNACDTIPKGVTAVSPFDAKKYLFGLNTTNINDKWIINTFGRKNLSRLSL